LRVTALIERIEAHPSGTRRIHLRIESDGFTFLAGQYVTVVDADDKPIPFSVASSPTRLPALELQFFPQPGSDAADAMCRLLEHEPRLTLDGPAGDVTLSGPTSQPLALVTSGTGIAQALAMVEFLATVDQRMPVYVYWHVAEVGALYCDHDWRRLDAARGWLHYCPLVGTVAGASADAAIMRDWLDAERPVLTVADVVLCGSPEFVHGVSDGLRGLGIASSSLRSDVFAYAPR
jgi:CDP-4-dehydro-6-deoxyglucose reductase, E3